MVSGILYVFINIINILTDAVNIQPHCISIIDTSYVIPIIDLNLCGTNYICTTRGSIYPEFNLIVTLNL